MKTKEIISELYWSVRSSLMRIRNEIDRIGLAVWKAGMQLKSAYYRRRAIKIEEKGTLRQRIRKVWQNLKESLKEGFNRGLEDFWRH